jgi:tRNA threonylcarbamoyladenosine biosynthesis protein TsaE
VLILTGDLGTGKTTFVQGLAQGLGLETRPRSPTFTMIQTHEGGRFPLVHVDLFRCSSPQEVVALGLEELLEPPAVSAVEWGEKAGDVAGADYLELEFTWDSDDEAIRTIRFLPYGRWRERMRDLSETVRAWATQGS